MTDGVLQQRIEQLIDDWTPRSEAPEETEDLERADVLECLRTALDYRQPHPGEPHEFRATCSRCGEPGMVNLSIVAWDERVEVVRRPDPILELLRPCARYWGSDGTLCSTHNGRFTSDAAVRCDRARSVTESVTGPTVTAPRDATRGDDAPLR